MAVLVILRFQRFSLLSTAELANCEAQWLSLWSVRLGIEGLLVRVSPQGESLCCVLEQDTLSDWYLLNPGRPILTWWDVIIKTNKQN